jgi:allantoicase
VTKSTQPDFASSYINLASPQLGAEAVFANDEFFASKERMLSPASPVFVFGKKDDTRPGLYMDGWETRRRRTEGHDYCIVKLGIPGIIHGFDIDTSHFTGNFPPAASIEGCFSAQKIPADDTQWAEILPATELSGNSHHFLPASHPGAFTHIRLNIYPDGGVARLRVYGEAAVDWEKANQSAAHELSALRLGGRALAASDQHYGSPNNLLLPGSGDSPIDGWETRRRRSPGNEWVVIELGHRGRISEIEVDTAHFRGNYPDRCSVLAADLSGVDVPGIVTQSMFWRVLLPEQKLEMHKRHVFEREILDLGGVSHLRFNVFPDGGVMRFRASGKLA